MLHFVDIKLNKMTSQDVVLFPQCHLWLTYPPSAKDSFFQGKAHVVIKDKISQPSSALRHSTELINILEKEDYKPILITVSRAVNQCYLIDYQSISATGGQ